jgi:starvation-inducible DNA-binding protein
MPIRSIYSPNCAKTTRALLAGMREVHDLCSDKNDVATSSTLENSIDETERRIWFLFETGQTN